MLLSHASDDFDEPDTVRRLLRDLKEVRMAKLRKGVKVLDGGAGVQMNGVGALEIAESRGFIAGVVDGLRCVDMECSPVAKSADNCATERSGPRENRHAKKETPRKLKMAMQPALLTTKMMICYEQTKHYKRILAPIPCP